MKILHSADLHLDTPFKGRTPEQTEYLRSCLLNVPDQLAQLCQQEKCQLVLLSGDIFDGPWSRNSFFALCNALEECDVPVFISPGNHDYVNHNSPYTSQPWPSNVHIFKNPVMESVLLEDMDCRIYGAGYRSMDCGPLLQNFYAKTDARYHIGVLHGDPTTPTSPCCPVTAAQIANSGLDYLALGHIHKQGQARHGHTLCAWPGSPMGRGFDETGIKGALVVTLDNAAQAEFVPLDTPRFFDKTTTTDALTTVLPPLGNKHFYRITLTGEGQTPALPELQAQCTHFPNLQLRDHRTPPTNLWDGISADTLEGAYFRILKDAMQEADDETRQIILQAAKISRQILDGQEVVLP